MHATKSVLRSLDSVYHSALRFVIKAEYSTHHCSLYSLSGWPPLSIRRQHHWLIFIYKAVIGLLSSYLSVFSFAENNRYNLRSKNSILFTIPAVKSEFGKIAFRYNAPSTWNALQKQLKLSTFITLNDFKLYITETFSYKCDCILVSVLFLYSACGFLYCLLYDVWVIMLYFCVILCLLLYLIFVFVRCCGMVLWCCYVIM